VGLFRRNVETGTRRVWSICRDAASYQPRAAMTRAVFRMLGEHTKKSA